MSFEPKIVGFVCNWCTYRGADLAGTSRIKYSPNIRMVRVMCSGRVSPLFVFKAFLMGADGVFIGGCHPGDCHYVKGDLYARRRVVMTKKLLEAIGIEPERLRLEWIDASEGTRFAWCVDDFTQKIKELGPSPLRESA